MARPPAPAPAAPMAVVTVVVVATPEADPPCNEVSVVFISNTLPLSLGKILISTTTIEILYLVDE
eukprot:scaffold334902_cov18-Prasinocladus_malaysianus.AAC.1